MSLQPLKLLFYVTAAALETSLLHLGASLLSVAFAGYASVSWPALLALCLLAAWTTARFEPVEGVGGGTTRPVTLLIAALAVSYTVKVQAGGGVSLLSGWDAVLPFATSDARSALGVPALVLLCLGVWWRGMLLIDHDHGSLLATLQRGVLSVVVLTLIITPGSRVNLGAPPWGEVLAFQSIMTVGFGLISLSLARITSEPNSRLGRGAWHWFRSSLGTTLAILVVGTLLLSLVADPATSALRTVVLVVGAFAAIIFAPLAVWLIELLRAFWAQGRNVILPVPQASDVVSASPAPSPDEQTQQLVELFVGLLTALVYLLPLAALIGLIVLLRRRRRAPGEHDDALHESLWSWRDISADLLGLIKGLRQAGAAPGLRDSLRRLRVDDPVQRIRRRYIQLLLLGETGQRERLPHQTPLEHEPALASIVSASAQLHTLTTLYDRARYAPDTVDPADAVAADSAWSAIKTTSATKENP